MLLAYEPLVAPARARAELWRSLLGLGVIASVYFLWMIGMGGALWLAGGMARFEAQLVRIGTGGDPWSLILLLSTFLGAWFGTWLTMRVLHRRRMRSLLGRAPLVLRDFVVGVLVMVVVGGGLTLLMAPILPELRLTEDPRLWLAFLPLGLLGVLIQTGAEELVFRGYLQSQLAARFGRPVIYLTLPSLLFGFAHFSPEEMGGNVWLVVAATALFGLIAADLTQRTGALGFAWGLHFANNVLAILILSVAGGLDGLALLHPVTPTEEGLLRNLLIADMLLMLAVWAVCRLWIRRR